MHFKGANQRLIREYNDRRAAAWDTAWLHRVGAKKFPKRETMFHNEKSEVPRRQSGEEQLAIAKAWMAGRKKRAG